MRPQTPGGVSRCLAADAKVFGQAAAVSDFHAGGRAAHGHFEKVYPALRIVAYFPEPVGRWKYDLAAILAIGD